MEKYVKKIMIIDDCEEIRDLVQMYLERNNCQFFLLSDGQFAHKIFHDNKIDLLICDMIMPYCDGIEVIQKIKMNDPEAKIIGISGGGNSDYLTLAQDFGADSTLYKPFTQKELLKKIDSIGFSFHSP